MARLPRFLFPGHSHHVTQRGNGRQQTFFSDADYAAYRAATGKDPPSLFGNASLGDILGKIWGAPNTVLGLIFAGVSYVAGEILGTDPKFTIGNNAIQLLNSPLLLNQRAVTIGNVQIYPQGVGPDSVVPYSYSATNVVVGFHEEGHTYQSQTFGIFYLPIIGITSLLGSNPMETQADSYAKAHQP